MKYLVFVISLLIATCVWPQRDQRRLFKCLGEEEKKLHLKKDTGPTYGLNQKIISEMIQIPKAELKPEIYADICNGKSSPSWKLLENAIRHGKSIFIIPASVAEIQKEITLGMIEDFMTATREIFLGHITQIQTLSPTPTCLKEEIPLLDAFFTDIKYLEEDLDLKKIFEGRDVKIFEKLEGWPTAFQRCKARLKKKTSPSSTDGAKKS